ncbi:hypothetical protein V494_02724 [Pseudogymnoascus sp. VKM F-4513 (FW-928)]|nr:hypothetical protein V494_02724 [Pseudogymnoascus sp. VKM F-4513 (FW-928)]
MTSLLAKYISKKFLGESLKNNFGTDDPYFESVPATRLNGKPSKKMKKVRKALPPGISEHDGKVLTKVKRRAYRLDMSLFNCCGIRFGWGSVLGIIPGFGDVLDAFMAMMVYRTCQQVEGGLPAAVQSQMMFNIVVDFFVGLVPFLGDLADAVFRANTKNAAVLEKHLRAKGQARLKSQGATIPTVDPSDPDEFDRLMASGPPPAYTAGEPSQQPPMRQTAPSQTTQGQTTAPRTKTGTTTTQTSGGGGGWFGGWGKKSKQPDIERAAGQRHDDTPLSDLPTRPTRA